jgi:hypothetical protein
MLSLITTFINYGLIFITLGQVYSWPMAWLDFVYGIPYEVSLSNIMTDEAGNPSWRGRNSTCNLLALISSDQLLFTLKLYFFFFAKQPILMRRSTVLILPFHQGFPGWSHNIFNVIWRMLDKRRHDIVSTRHFVELKKLILNNVHEMI